MTMVAMPTARASEMPVAAAGSANAPVGKDASAAAAGQFRDVLGQRAQVAGRPATVRVADEVDRPSMGKRGETRGQGRKDEAKVGPDQGMRAGVVSGAGPMVGSSALPVDASPTSEAEAGIGPEVGWTGLVSRARDAGGEASGASAGIVEMAETGAVGKVDADAEDGAAALKDVSAIGGDAAAGSAMGAHVESGLPPKVVTDMVAATSGAPLAGMLTASASAVSGAAIGAVAAAASASTGSLKQQGSGGKGIQGKASTADRRAVAGDATTAMQGQDGRANIGGKGGAQTGLMGENRRGQHDARPAGKGIGGAAETTGGDGVASDGRSSGPAQPAVSGTPMQVLAERTLPVTAVPVEASRGVSAIDPKAGGAEDGASLGSAAAGLAEASGGSGVAEAATPLTSVGAARLLKTVAGSELRVGTQSADLGAVTIRTVLGRDQMEAHISFENERMGPALSAHLLGGMLEDRLGQSLGVRASVTLSAGADGGTGQSGREAAREAMTGQAGGQDRSGSGRNGSGRYGAEALGGFGGSGRRDAGSGVGRPMPYGGSAAMEGRLDVRV